jgi:mannose-6-phosphate isomerase-like protein (cupin superfamily)
MTRNPVRIPHAQWTTNRDYWHGHVDGRDLGTGVTVLFYATEVKGRGPVWHVHPYDEVFIIREGRALYTIGEEKIVAEKGDVLLGPANVPHKFVNIGDGRLDTVDIHLSDRWIQTDLPDPEAI